jgi:Acetyltransferase (GNAT) domain
MWGVNVFSSAPFLETLASTYFPGKSIEIARYSVEGHEFQLLGVDGKSPLTTWPLVDYWEPVASATSDPAAATPLRSLPRVALEIIAVDGRPTDLGELSPSPLLRYSGFTTWPDVDQHLHARAPRVGADSRRRLRRIERELGDITLSIGDADDAAVDACIAWKVDQFRGAARLYRDARHATFIRALRDLGVAEVATLRVGDRTIAVHVGLRHEGRFSSWVPAYDAACGAYAPGRLLLEHLLQTSFERGDTEFDFLVGNEPYKWQYATHTRLVGPLGPQPRLPEATRRLRRRLRLGRKYLALRQALGPSTPSSGG